MESVFVPAVLVVIQKLVNLMEQIICVEMQQVLVMNLSIVMG